MKYKVGDKVRIKNIDWWDNNNVNGRVKFNNLDFISGMDKFCGKIVTITEVYPISERYKISEDDDTWSWTDDMIEGLVEEETKFDTTLYGRIYTKPNESYCDLTREKDDVSTTYRKVDELATKIDKELPSGNQNVWELPYGYQFVDENGNVINATTIALEKKKTEYPKTYEECCRIVNANPCIRLMYDLSNGQKYSYDADNLRLYESIRKLLICRDAYWKIYGEQMGLGKPWEPDWQGEGCYVIVNHRGDIVTDVQWHANAILAFPTEKMRDAFFEHFKKDIEQCKELL